MMTDPGSLFLGKAAGPIQMPLRYANRHGLIAGATGTGKTITLQVLAEGFSAAGTCVFLTDVKGDLSGLCAPGDISGKLAARAKSVGLDTLAARSFPCVFWDLFGEQGHPVRATVSGIGPLLLARLFDLNDAQEGVLHAAFALADDEGMLLLDLKDLRAILGFVADNAKTLSKTYGHIAAASVGAVQRRLLMIEREGGALFMGEPALDIQDLLRRDRHGAGNIHILASDTLINKPRLYATFLLWLFSELFETLPEVGDLDQPKLVLFFDEAHLLFDGAPKALIDKVEQVVRLIRSKGVGVFFVTQNPTDLPETVLGQLGNRIQHALRAFTARDQKAVRATAQTFRANPAFDTEKAITELEVGEALVSTLDAQGAPTIVERTLLRPPSSRLGSATAEQRSAAMAASPFAGRYDISLERHSAYEQLAARAEAAAEPHGAARNPSRATHRRETTLEAMTKSAVRSIGSQIGREIARGVLGSLFRRR
jgi:DNA helicase HerA-like ATPase